MSKTQLLTPTMLFCFLTILMSHFPNFVTSLLPLSEQATLHKIRHHWELQYLWDSTTSPCNWLGIKCIGGRTVTEISFENQYLELENEIPPYICNLQNLTTLYLGGNYISGKFPTFLYNCTKLQQLDLSSNYFVGELPKDINKLSPNLQYLDLSSNTFTGKFPTFLYNCTKLQKLDLSLNKFSGQLPKDINKVSPNLQYLDLSSNRFIGKFPIFLYNYTKLQTLDLSNNKFGGQLPKDINKLSSNLQYLDLSYNRFTGKFPTISYNCTKLQTLDLSRNQFSGQLPKDINNFFPYLQHLNLSYNSFTGNIPTSLAKLKGLITLRLEFNSFNGSFPSELGSLENLDELSLGSNSFPPTQFPKEFGMLKSLKILIMSHCQLIGEIPNDLANSLEQLDLSINRLSGVLPSNIVSWKLLETLDLSNNSLSGPVPAALISLPLVKHLDLSNNKFSGKIPDAFNHVYYDYNLNGNANLSAESSNFTDNAVISLHSSHSSTHKFLALIVASGATIFLIFIYITILMVNRRKKEERSSEQQSTWELKPFHRIDFTETNIVSGLIAASMIGSGGSGSVYMIIVNDAGDKVAVKRIWKGRKLENALEKQFLAEVEILGTFRHTNIVKLWCCVSSAQEKLLVYEYMENQSLDKWLHRKRRESVNSSNIHTVLDWSMRIRIAVGAARGLCYLHNECSPPIIHRDLKSSNILLDLQFNAKIADFGLAKMTYKTGDPHTASAIVGSFGYMAPEYWRTKRMNEKIDVYSFGVVLLELATGKHPCKGNDHLNLADWSWQYCCEEHSIVEALDEDIKEPRFMENMVNVFKLGLMCTSKTPSSRPTMQLVVQLLVEWSDSENCERALTIDEGN